MAGGRKSKAAAPARPQTTLVLDNGAYTLKAGLVARASDAAAPVVIPNCIARDRARNIYVGADVERCRDYGEMQFRRPVEKGFIVNWEAQKEIWDHHLFRGPLQCDPAETRLVLAEPPNGLPALQANCDQVVFEEYGFVSYYRGLGTQPPAPRAQTFCRTQKMGCRGCRAADARLKSRPCLQCLPRRPGPLPNPPRSAKRLQRARRYRPRHRLRVLAHDRHPRVARPAASLGRAPARRGRQGAHQLPDAPRLDAPL